MKTTNNTPNTSRQGYGSSLDEGGTFTTGPFAGQHVTEIENENLTRKQLDAKITALEEGHEDQSLIDQCKRELRLRRIQMRERFAETRRILAPTASISETTKELERRSIQKVKSERPVDEAYKKSQKQIDRLMEELKNRLTKHAARQQQDPRDWGYAGDLEHTISQLWDAVEFLKG